MASFKSRFGRAAGVKIFFLCWILVALVPLWRLRATRQWQNPQLISHLVSFNDEVAEPLKLGLTPQNARDLARFEGDAAAQLTALSQPNLGLSNAQVRDSSGQSWQARTEKYFTRFAELSRRFPDDLAIRSQWLRDATQGQLAIESADLIATYGNPAPITATYTEPWLSALQREASLRCAREGAQREPDNAFWPWMEAMFGFSLRRDALAIAALERAGKCRFFDDGTLETARRRIALIRRVQLADTEDELWEAWSITFPHFGRMRQATRQAIWQANLAQKKGDTARALAIAGVLQRAALPVARAKDMLITRLIGEALCYVTWGQTLRYAGLKQPANSEDPAEAAVRREYATRFAAYATARGRTDLAQQALQIQASFNTVSLRDALKNPQFDDLSNQTERLSQWHWTGAWLLRMAIFAGAVWLFLVLIARFRLEAPSPTRRAMAIWSAFCLGATVAILTAVLRLGTFGMAAYDAGSAYNAGRAELNAKLILGSLPMILLALWLAPGAFGIMNGVLGRLREQWRPTWRLRGFRWLAVIEALIHAALVGTGIWFVLAFGARQGSVLHQFYDVALISCLIAFAAAMILQIARARNRLATALLWSAPWLGLGAWWISPGFEGNFYGPVGWFLALLCFLLGLSAYRDGWQEKTRELLAVLAEGATRTRIAAATLAVAASLAYFALILAAIPVRGQAQATLDRHLQIGQVALIEERMAQKGK